MARFFGHRNGRDAPTVYVDGTDDEGNEGSFEKELPWRWEICSACRGNGVSSAYLGAFTGEEMREDPDFAEDYMNGVYDRPCEEGCESGKIKVVDEARCEPGLLKQYREEQADLDECDAIHRAEMRMGA